MDGLKPKKVIRIGSLAHEDIAFITRAVMRQVEALKTEQNNNIQSLEVTNQDDRVQLGIIEEKRGLVRKNTVKMELGLEEAKAMITLSSYLQNARSEIEKLRIQVRRICMENNWLRNEVKTTLQKLQVSEQNLVLLEEEKKHADFLASLRKYDKDADVPSPTGDDGTTKDCDSYISA